MVIGGNPGGLKGPDEIVPSCQTMPGGSLRWSPLEAGRCACGAPCSHGPHSPAHPPYSYAEGLDSVFLATLPARSLGKDGKGKAWSPTVLSIPFPSTLCTFLDTWIDTNPEEFSQTSDLSILRKLKTYLIVNMPYSDLLVRVHMLLMDLQKEEASESESEEEEDSGRCLNPCVCVESSAAGLLSRGL